MANEAASAALDPRTQRRAVLAAVIGNGLEFYDFLIYAFFAIQIGRAFFPSGDPFLSLMGSLAAFGAGFISRPIGAWLLGSYADRHGRKPAMLASMLLMGLGIALLALTPGYAAIGIAAPIIAVIARLIQGFALGGEVGSSTTYLIETAPPHRRGLITSLQGASQAVAGAAGGLVGLLLSLTLSEQALASYGWRIALLAGTLIVPVAIYVRRTLPETLHDTSNDDDDDFAPLVTAGTGQMQRAVVRIVILGMMLIGARTICSYTFHYMATYAQNTLKMPVTAAMTGLLATNIAFLIAAILGGWLSDRIGRRKMMIVPMICFILLIVPCFLWLTTERTLMVFVTANVVLGFFSYLNNGPVYVAIGESLPKRIRARGFSMIYALPATILGGTTQLVITWILYITGNSMAVAWYLTAVAVIGLGAMLLMPESAPGHRRRVIAT